MIFVFGVLLRLTMKWNYDVAWAYDAEDHWQVVQWIGSHGRVPPPEALTEAFHPPLFYAVVAWFVKHGVARASMTWLTIAFGTVRLAIIWAGLELYVKHSRLARIVALVLASMISASVHIDGMVYPEALSCLWNALALLLMPMAFQRYGAARWPLTLALGLVLGLAMLTKISTFATLSALGLAVIIELIASRKQLTERVANALPWVSTLVVVVALSGWYYARNVREYGRPFVTSFDLPSQQWVVREAQARPFLDRRTLGFVFGWDKSIYYYPFPQGNIGPNPRFLPVALATTFTDFFLYGFCGYDKPLPSPGQEREMRGMKTFAGVARLAVVGGTILLVPTLCTWLIAFHRLLRNHDFGRLALLLVPMVTTLAALQFAIACPTETFGVVKGTYMTFAAPPLYALVGVAAAWAQRRPHRWPVLGAILVGLMLVAVYTLDCRFGLYLSRFTS